MHFFHNPVKPVYLGGMLVLHAMDYSNRHLRFGWWLLLVSLSLGLTLEALHGFKLGWYLDVTNETRQLMLTLAHAHGTLLALVNIAAGLTTRGVAGFTLRPSVSFALVLGSVLLPLGFLLGGLVIYDGDPGLAVLLVPLGGIFLLYAVGRAAWDLSRSLG